MLTIVSLQHAERRLTPLEIKRQHIKIDVKNQLATTQVDQIFVNPNPFEVKGMYLFPVPDNAVVSNLALSVDGKSMSGELLSAAESRRMYQNSAHYGDNRAILEHIGTRAFAARVSEIPANAVRNIRFEYSQVVPVDSDLAKYTYPLALAKSASGLIAELRIEMEIESSDALKTVFSPSHDIVSTRKGDRQVHVSYVDKNVDPDDNFHCYISTSNKDFGITLLTHRAEENEDGYFMLVISPKYEVKKTDIVEKDFIFVLDRSGSMADRKVEQAKEALRYCVRNLNDGDRFNLILFNEGITTLADRLSRGEEWFDGERWPDSTALSHKLLDVKDGRDKALAFIEDIYGRGGTNINDALLTALRESPDPNRPRTVVFLTDGQQTVGTRNPARILENVAKANERQSRIFVFGVGYDVNDHLLDKLAADNRGSRNYVTPDEDIEVAVSTLFRKMNEPVLVDVSLDFGHVLTKDMSPRKLPDLFREEQLTLLGRYEGHGDTRLTVAGIVGKERQEFSESVHFSKLESDNDFLPHLWAQRRIAELVDEAALSGGSEELEKEIERISTEYGVLTPHTSFVTGDDGSRRYMSRIRDAYYEAPINRRIEHTREIESRKSALHMQQYDDTKYIAGKAFHYWNGIWVDNQYDGKSKRQKVVLGSDAYDHLIEGFPELRKYVRLGSVIICYKGVNYEITG